MNITLSADENLIKGSREYAKKQNTTLNNLIREYLKKIVGEKETNEIIDEFSDLAKNHAGESSKGYRFNREEIYSRGI